MATRADPMLSMPLVWVLPPDPASAALVRRRLGDLLACEPRELVEDVILIACELVTNAVLHGDGAVAVTIWPSTCPLRIEVTDNGPGAPRQRRDPHEEDETGRGLKIVDALSTTWGVTPKAHGPGKTVWFEMGAPAPAATR
jgi:anti-sigma regulatory factor (Ser/Thr protein kinase)